MLTKLLNELSSYQERMHRKSKKKFREYLRKKAEAANLDYNILPNSFLSKNVVIGDLRKAKYVLGAHYDTPPRMPAFLMKSVLFFNILLIGIMVLLFVLAIIFEIDLLFLALIYLIGLLYIMGIGIANKYNYNDNTSGVLTLLALLERLNNPDVAYVFFDNEEKGLIGSLQLAVLLKKHKGFLPRKKVFINFDCVGRGNVFGIVSFGNKGIAQDLIELNNDENLSFEHRKPSILEGSDHFSFKTWNSLGIMCYNKEGKKYKLANIHSHKDKSIELSNIEVLVNVIQNYIDKDGI